MVTQLIHNERIETTLARARELRRMADKAVTLAKKVGMHSLTRRTRDFRYCCTLMIAACFYASCAREHVLRLWLQGWGPEGLLAAFAGHAARAQ